MATKIIIPRGSGEGGLGIQSVSWGQAYFDQGHFTSLQVGGKNVLVSGDVADYSVSEADVTGFQSSLTITESQISDLGSYISSVSEADVTGYQSSLTISESQISDLGSYISSVSQSDVTAHEAALTISESQISDLGSYISSVSQSDVTAHEAALSIAASQVSGLESALTTYQRKSPDGSLDVSGSIQVSGDLKIGDAIINSENDRLVFGTVPAALDNIGNPQTFLTAQKLGLGTTENLKQTSQDVEFKLLTDENRFVVGTTGDGDLASGWYRFNDFNVKGATDVGAHPLNPVDTRIYSDSDSFVYMTRDAYGNRVAHLVGGDEQVSPSNNIALGLAIKIDEADTPQDIEFTHTDGNQYSVINGDSDDKGVNGIPIRQGFQAATIGGTPQPLLIDGGYF